MKYRLSKRADDGYDRLEQDGEDVDSADELISLLVKAQPALFDTTLDAFKLGRFRVHRLKGLLNGWWGSHFAVLKNDQIAVLVFYALGHQVNIVAIDEHDSAYSAARIERAELAARPGRRKFKLLRLR